VGKLPPRAFESPSATLQLFAKDPAEAHRRVRRWMDAPPAPDDQLTPRTEEIRSDIRSARAEPPEPGELNGLIATVCNAYGIPRDALGPGRRSQRVVAARAELSRRAVRELGLPSRTLAEALGVSDSTISRALASRQPATKKRR